jgi:alkylation response protein AidB-like acyl-CoA dehydrogenase
VSVSSHFEEPKPLYCVYRVQARSIVCHRVVQNNPAQVGDFLTFLDTGIRNFDWWDIARAVGLSAWVDPEKAAALARRKGRRWIATVDLSRADPLTPWGFTGTSGHITIWAPAPILLPAVVDYTSVG